MERVTITLYQFDELSEKAKQKAIFEHREFLLTTMQPEDFISGDPQYDTPVLLQKSYNAQFAYYCENDEPIVESIEINDYWFFHDGTLADVTTYTAGPNKGKSIFTFHGETDVFIAGGDTQ